MTQNNFNGGVVTSWINSRYDLQRFGNALGHCENFICTPYGALRRRMGTEYVDSIAGTSRLISFQLSSTVGYVLSFSDELVEVYRDGAKIGSVSMVSPWSDVEVFELQYIKLNAQMFITHKNHPPQKITFTNETTWSLAPIDFDYPPFQDEILNDDTLTVTADASSPITNTLSINLIDDPVQQVSGTITAVGLYELDVTTWTDGGGGASELQGASDGVTWVKLQDITGTGVISGTFPVGLLRVVSTDAALIADLETTNNVYDLSAGDSVTVTASASTFDALHVGSQFEISHVPTEREVKILLNTTDATSAPLIVQGTWNLFTTGIWQGDVFVEESKDNGSTWDQVVKRSGSNDVNLSETGTQTEITLMRVRFETAGGGSQYPYATLENDGAAVSGRVEITAFTSATEVDATVITRIYSEDATDLWRKPAWSDFSGYPAAITWHESRLWYGGSVEFPSTLWASRTNDFFYFKNGTNDDDSFFRAMATTELTEIVWLLSHQSLYIGTNGEEWRGFSQSDLGVITPQNFILRRISNSGSDPVSPILAGASVIHVQRQGRSLFEIGYDATSATAEGYKPTDLNQLAPHVTTGGLKTVSYQSIRDKTVWATTGDGKLIGLTFDRGQNISGWHEHTSDTGLFESVAVVYEEGNEDSIYVVINRDGTRMVERFRVDQYNIIENQTQDNGIFVDSAISYSGVATSTFTGLSHLEGKTVYLVSGGEWDGAEYTVSSGEITAGEDFTEAYVGLPYTSLMETLPFSFQDSIGKKKKVHGFRARVFKSVRLEANEAKDSPKPWEMFTNNWRNNYDPIETQTENVKGNLEDWKLPISSSHDADARLAIRLSQPYPLNILAIVPRLAVHE